MRRFVALFALTLCPAFAMAMPAQAAQQTVPAETQTQGSNGEDVQEVAERTTQARPASNADTRTRKAPRSAVRVTTRPQSFLPGMFR